LLLKEQDFVLVLEKMIPIYLEAAKYTDHKISLNKISSNKNLELIFAGPLVSFRVDSTADLIVEQQ